MTDIVSCIQIKSILSAYFDEELSFEEKTRVENHLMLCPACKNELDSIKKLSGVLKNYSGKFETTPHNLNLTEIVMTRFAFFQKQRKIIYSAVAICLIMVTTFFSIKIIWLNQKQETIHKVKFIESTEAGLKQDKIIPNAISPHQKKN